MKKVLILLLFCGLLFPISKVAAQCAVCAAQVQTNLKEGNNQAKGLNAGILYLMFTPYLLVGAVGIIWVKKYKKSNTLVDIKDEKINLN